MYVQPKDAKKSVPFEIPVKQEDTTPLVSCPDNIPDVSIKHTPDLKGTFKMLRDRRLKFTSYEEYNP